MGSRLLISKWQTFAAITFAIAFPLSNLIGGWVQTFFLFATSPFLFIDYFAGWLAVSAFGSAKVFTFGVALSTFIQVWLLFAFLNQRKAPSIGM